MPGLEEDTDTEDSGANIFSLGAGLYAYSFRIDGSHQTTSEQHPTHNVTGSLVSKESIRNLLRKKLEQMLGKELKGECVIGSDDKQLGDEVGNIHEVCTTLNCAALTDSSGKLFPPVPHRATHPLPP